MKYLALAALSLPVPALAQEESPTPASVVAASQPGDWKAIAPDDLLVMELAPDAAGKPREVVIQLLPPPFSQPWVENIRTLARAHWWDGSSVYRVVDNWVAQWGGGDPEMGMAERPLPEGGVSPTAEYVTTWGESDGSIRLWHPSDYLEDSYAHWAKFIDGWPAAYVISDDTTQLHGWPVHCYASVGVARDLAPDTGTGSELYAVIGHAPRQLDRNIAVVGRVIDGIEHLSTLKRGTADAGVYEARAEDTPILSVRLGTELTTPPAFEYLDTESESFARYAEISANRSDAFYQVAAGGIDVCNLKVPIRQIEPGLGE